jgi:GT2 family glycosyltransferase
MKGLTIAICTRNRPDDVRNCVESIGLQKKIPADLPVEVLLIDDGEMPPPLIDSYKVLLPPKFTVRYYKKEKKGLFLSRLEAIRQASHDVLLFLDDDVTIMEDYLSVLWTTYAENGSAAGVGGIDILVKKYVFPENLFFRLFMISSSDRGKLSFTGFPNSMNTWGEADTAFETDFLSGCNMSFRKDALEDLGPVEWLHNYSLGEDIFFSLIAGKKGALIVNPSLRVKHCRATSSRDDVETIAYTRVLNHFLLLRYFFPNSARQLCFFWTVLGLHVGAIAKMRWRVLKGFARGFLSAVHLMGSKK